MYLHEFQVPISDYYGEKVFFQSVFFITDEWRSPSKEDFLKAAALRHNEDSKSPLYIGTWKEVEWAALNVASFPRIHPGCVQTNDFVIHPKFGQQPFTVITREVFDIRDGGKFKLEF